MNSKISSVSDLKNKEIHLSRRVSQNFSRGYDSAAEKQKGEISEILTTLKQAEVEKTKEIHWKNHVEEIKQEHLEKFGHLFCYHKGRESIGTVNHALLGKMFDYFVDQRFSSEKEVSEYFSKSVKYLFGNDQKKIKKNIFDYCIDEMRDERTDKITPHGLSNLIKFQGKFLDFVYYVTTAFKEHNVFHPYERFNSSISDIDAYKYNGYTSSTNKFKNKDGTIRVLY